MARLTLDLPSELGRAGRATETGCGVESRAGSGVESRAGSGVESRAGSGVESRAGSGVESRAGSERPSIVDDATRTFVRWFDCWAGR